MDWKPIAIIGGLAIAGYYLMRSGGFAAHGPPATTAVTPAQPTQPTPQVLVTPPAQTTTTYNVTMPENPFPTVLEEKIPGPAKTVKQVTPTKPHIHREGQAVTPGTIKADIEETIWSPGATDEYKLKRTLQRQEKIRRWGYGPR